MHNKQLRAPVFATDLMTTQVSSETQSVSPPFSPLEGEPHTSSSADHDTCTSSVQACSAIFTPKQAHFVMLPSSPDIRSAQEHDQPLHNWSTHHRSSATRFKPDLIVCEDGTSLWTDGSATPRAFLYRPRYRALFSTVCIVSHIQDSKPDWCLRNVPTSGKA